jgi:hypothetical protein
MGSTIKNQVETCIDELKRGTLTEEGLRRIAEIADEARAMQDILYLHAAANSPISEVLAMRIVESGEISDGPENPADWPYQSVLEAIRDGWRVVKFPELALMMDESRTYSLGFEFILERNGGIR